MKKALIYAVAMVLVIGVSVFVTANAVTPNFSGAYKYKPNKIFTQYDYTACVGAKLVNGGSVELGSSNHLDDRGDYHLAFAYTFDHDGSQLSAGDVQKRIQAFYDGASDRPISWVNPGSSSFCVGRYRNGDLNGVIRIFASQVSSSRVEVVTECSENLSIR